MSISERYTTERDEKAPKNWRGPFMITEAHQEGRFYRLSTGRAAHYENIKPHNPTTEDWCIPADMEEGDYLMMDPACEVNEKGNREKNDGNQVVEEGTNTPLDLDPNEKIEAVMKPYPTQKRIGRIPNRWRFPKIWNRISRSQYRLDKATGEDTERNTTLTVTTL